MCRSYGQMVYQKPFLKFTLNQTLPCTPDCWGE